jgi:hypothetical protein
MRFRRLAQLIGLSIPLGACVVHDTMPVNQGYGYGYGYGAAYQPPTTLVTPSSFSVSSMPPEPLYEQMSPSPGYGYVWIDGYWHWNGYEWVWVSGRWERQQEGYVYVQPYYDYVGGAYVYTPGYWSRPDRVPSGWQVRDHRDPSRPSSVGPPPGWHTPNPPPRQVYGGGGPGYPGVRPTQVAPEPIHPVTPGGVEPPVHPAQPGQQLPGRVVDPVHGAPGPGVRPTEPEPPHPVGPVHPVGPEPPRAPADPGYGRPTAPPPTPVAPPPRPVAPPPAPPMHPSAPPPPPRPAAPPPPPASHPSAPPPASHPTHNK